MNRKQKRSDSAAAGPSPAPSRAGGLLALERRIAFDAAIVDTLAEAAEKSAPEPAPDGSSAHDPGLPVPMADAASARQEIVFIDASVQDAGALLAGLNNPGAEVVLIDSGRDGVAQMAEALAGRSGIDAIHILSHGSTGSVNLGSTTLSAGSIIGEHAAALAAIGDALSVDADIVIYGCNFGGSEQGEAAIKALAAVTGADIAASDDITGHADLGGDWDLERQIGSIETQIVVSPEVMTEWRYTLIASTVDFGSSFGATNQNVTSTALTATINGVQVSLTGVPAPGAVSTSRTLQVQPTAALATYGPGFINSTLDASTDNGTAFNQVTITFSQPVYAVSFSIVDIDGKGLYATGAGANFNDIMTVSSNAGAATAVNTGSNVNYDTATGLTSTRGGNVSNSTDGTATYFFANPITQLTIQHVSGDVVGVTDPASQGIQITDIAFNTSASWTTNEDQSVQLNGIISGSNVSGNITMTLSVPASTGSLTAANGGGVTVTGSGTTSITLSGSRGAIDAYLAGASAPTFSPSADRNGLVTLTQATSDGASNYTDTRSIVVLPVNDAPSGTNNTVTLNEDAVHTLTVANFGFTDAIDTGQQLNGVVIPTLPVGGTLRVNGVAVTAGQFISHLDIANNLVTFTPTLNLNGTGAASISFQVRDNGGTQNGGANTDPTPNTLTFNLTALNDAPVNTIQTNYSAVVSTPMIINGLQVADPDAATGTMTTRLQVSSGTLQLLTGVTGITLTNNNSNNVLITGTLSAINTLLSSVNGVQFTPTASTGNVTLTMTTNDGGNTGGAAQQDLDTATITVQASNPNNDAPVNTLPATYAATEDTPRALTGISIADVDIGSGNATVTFDFTAGTGALTLRTDVAGGLTAGQITNNGSASVTINATIAEINATLAAANGLVFTPVLNSTSSVTLRMVTNDNGGTGPGGPLTDTDTSTISIAAVNDGPILGGPGAVTYTENTSAVAVSPALTLSDPEGNPIAGATVAITNFAYGEDVLAFTANASLYGNIAAGFNPSTGILTLTSAGNTATIAQWEAALRSITYRNTSENPTGASRSITYAVIDNQGANFTSNTITATVTIAPVNDAPVNTVPGAQTTAEDTARVFSVANGNAITINDIDINGANFTTTVSMGAGQGTLTAVASGASIIGNGTSSVQITGTKAQVEAALNGLSYLPALNFNGTATLTVLTSDGGGTGSGGALTDSDNITITVTAVNDAPVAVADSFQTAHDTAVTINVRANDTDVEGSALTVTAVNGTAITAGGPAVAVTGGTVALNLSGNLVFTPNANTSGAASFTYTISDGALTASAAVTGVVTNVSPYVGVSNGANLLTNGDFESPVVSVVNGNNLSGMNWGGWAAGGGATDVNPLRVNGTPYTSGPDNAFSGSQYVDLNGNGTLSQSFTVLTGGAFFFGADFANRETANGGFTVPTAFVEILNSSGVVVATTANANLTRAMGDEVWVSSYSSTTLAAGTYTYRITLGNFGHVDNAFVRSLDVNAGTFTENGAAVPIANPSSFVVDRDDADLESATVTLTNPQTGDRLLVDGSSGPNGTLPSGIAWTRTDNVVTFSGSRSTADYNAAIRLVSFENTTDTPAVIDRTITVSVNDGIAASPVATSTIAVAAVNDAPVVAVAIPDQAISEDSAWTYQVPAGTFSDIDSGSLTYAATMSDGSALPSWLTFNPATRTFTGTPPLDFNGVIDLRVTASDGSLTASDVFRLTINPVNDAPVNSVPSAQVTNEDTALVFSLANGNAITVADVDIGAGNLTTTIILTPGTGVLTVVGGSGAGVSGDGSSSVTLTGTKAQIDAALNGLTYTPASNYFGVATLTVGTSDNGGSGSGGVLADSDQIQITVASVNDAPVNTVPGAQTMREDTTLAFSIATGNQLAINDVDGSSQTVTLSVTNGLLSLAQTVGLSFSVGTGANDATMTFSGSIAAINAALDGLVFTPAANFNGPVTLTLQTSDSAGGTATSNVAITVTSVNDAPVGADRTAAVDEDQTYTFSALDFGFSDPNDSPADGLQSVVIASLPLAGDGVLRLAGVAVTAGQEISVANLGSLTFTGAANRNGVGLAAFTFQVRDSGGAANGGVDLDPTVNTFRFDITPVNDAPVAQNDSITTAEDTAVTIAVRTNDGDVDGDALTIAAVNGTPVSVGVPVAVANGSVTLTADGRLTFAPALNYHGPASFAYTVSDPSGATSTANVSITVTPVNDAPTSPSAIAGQSAQDGATFSLPVAGNFDDVDGDILSYSAVGLPAGLSINPTTGVITGTLDRNASQGGVGGVYTVSVEARDPSGATVTRAFSFTVVNPPPIARDDSFAFDEDNAIAGSLVANNGSGADFDPDGDAITVQTTPVSGPANGIVVINGDGTFIYTPNLNYFGADTFTYRITDANGASSTATVSLTINPVNDAPVPPATIPARAGNDGQTISGVDLSTGWSDIEGQTLAFSAVGLPPGLSIAANGIVSGTITSDASTGDGSNDGVRVYTVALTATDASGAQTSRNFTWTVTNLPPDARDDLAGTAETTLLTGLNAITDAGAGRDIDPDGDTTLSIAEVNGASGLVGVAVAGSNGGVFTINADGSYTFDPGLDFVDVPAGQTRSTTVQYTLTDGQGGTDTATITVVVIGDNEVPIVTPLGNRNSLDGALINTTVATAFNDLDRDPLTFAITGGQLPAGLALDPATGAITGTISNQASQSNTAGNPAGVYTITITATDTSGASVSSTFTWTVTNPAPTAVNDPAQAWVEDSGTLANINVLANDVDPDGDTLTVVSASAAKGTVTINADGTLNYTPFANYNGTDTIIYQISDGNGGYSTASLNVVVADDNADAPVLIDPNTIPTLVNLDRDVVALPVNSYFVRGDAPIASFTTSGQLPPGVAFDGLTGSLSGTLAANASALPAGSPGVYLFSITAIDSNGLSVTQNIRWEISNPAPTATDDAQTVAENGTVTIDVLANDIDPDGGPANANAADLDDLVVSSASAANGTVTINPDGTLQYTPDPDFNGPDTITYTVSDGNGGVSTATVAVTVTPVNDPPVFAPGFSALPAQASNDSDALSVNLSPFFRDADLDPAIIQQPQGDVLAFSVTSGGLPPGLSLAADGRITGTIAAGASGPTGVTVYTATITVSDGRGGSLTTPLSWTVTNIAPVAAADAYTGPEDTAVQIPLAGLGSLVANDADPDGDIIRVSAVNGTAIRDAGGALIDGLAISTPNGAIVVDAANNRLVFQPDLNWHGVETIAYTLTDPNAGQSIASITVTITPVNDAPVAANDAAVTDEDTAITIDVIKAASTNGTPGKDIDVDGDALTVVGASVPAAQGVVSIVGNQLVFTPALDFNGVATVSYQVSDGSGGTATATVTVTVNPVNDAPVAAADAASTLEDTGVTINVRGNDGDVDGDAIAVETVNGQAISPGVPVAVPNGSVTLTAGGDLVFAPAADYNGPASFTYTLRDAQGASSAPVTVSINVVAVNDAPVAGNDAYLTAENTPLSGNLFAAAGGGPDSDVDGDTLSVTAVNAGAANVGQSVAGSGGGIFTIAANGAYTFAPGSDFDDLAPGETRNTTVQYTIGDGNGGFATATVTVTVDGRNDAPVIIDPATGLPSPTPLMQVPQQNTSDGMAMPPLNVSGFFRDADTSHALALSVPPGLLPAGIVFDAAAGVFSGTFASNASQGGTAGQPAGTYVIPVTATDPTGATVTTNVVFVVTNPAPVAGNDGAVVAEDGSVGGSVAGNDNDPDGDALAWSLVTGPSHGGLVFNADGSYVYTPVANFNGTDTFVYQVSDGQGGVRQATVTITVSPVNDAPVLTMPTSQTMLEDAVLTFSATGGNAIVVTDIDAGDVLTASLSIGAGSLNIASFAGLSVIGNGSASLTLVGATAAINAALDGLTYTPVSDVPGAQTLSVVINDGVLSATASLPVTIQPVADITADTATTAEDVAVTLAGVTNDSFENPGRQITAINGAAVIVGIPTVGANGSVTVNADGTILFAPAAHFFGTATFTYTVTSNGVSETATQTVIVNEINDTPVALPDAAITNEDTAVDIDVLGNDSDTDGDTLSVVTTGPNAPAAANGVVSVNPDGTLRYMPNPDFNGTDTITYTVSDGRGGFANSTVVVTVNGANDAPITAADTATTPEDSPVVIAVLANDIDTDGDALSVISASAGNGSVVINTDGTLTYAPALNFNGTDTITYRISDGRGGTAIGSVTVTVASVNDIPVAQPDIASVNEDSSVNIAVLGNDSDVDGDPMSIVATGPNAPMATNGTVSVNPDGTLRYTPIPNYDGADTITYTISDGRGGFATTTVTVTVNAVNDAPIAVDDSAITTEDTPVTVNILANDSDPDGDGLTVISATAGNGAVVINPDGTLSYTPSANYFGPDLITYRISDGNGGTAIATVTVTVTPVNDPPIVGPVGDRNSLDGQAVALPMASSFTDPENDPLTFSATGLPPGLVLNTTTGLISGTIDRSASIGGNVPGSPGVYQVSVTATDSQGNASTLNFRWAVANPAPVASDDAARMDEDTAAVLSPLANDVDPDGDPLTIMSAAAGLGAVTINGDGTLTYAPPADFFGTDTIVYSIRDADGLLSTAQIIVTVDPVNDGPMAIDPLPARSNLDGQTPAVSFGPLFSDPEGLPLSFEATGLPGGLSIDAATGAVVGSIAANASLINGGIYTVTVTATDAGGLALARSFVWTIANVGPMAENDSASTAEDTSVTIDVIRALDPPGTPGRDVDDDGDPLTIVAASVDPTQGAVAIIGNQLVFTPAANFNGVAAITYTIADDGGLQSTAVATVTVSAVNDDPVIALLPNVNAQDGEHLALDLASFFSDTDNGQTLTVSYAGLPAGLAFDSDGNISGQIAGDASQGGTNGVYVVTASVGDGAGGFTTRQFTISVGNPAPTAGDDVATTDEDMPVVIDLVKAGATAGTPGKDVDPDGDALVVVSALSGHGTVSIQHGGTVLYTPKPGFNGTDVITYTISDGEGGLSTATVTVTVNAVNDAPIAADDLAAVAEDGAVTISVLGNDSDPDGDGITIASASVDPSEGVVTVNPDGTLLFRPATDFNGVATITYTVSDGQGGSATATVSVTVSPVADAPRPSNDTTSTAEDQPVVIVLLQNDVDPDGEPLTITGASVDPSQGSVAVNPDGTVTFTPAPNFHGAATITYQVTDSTGRTSTATALVTVTPVNDPLIAGADAATTLEDHAVVVDVLGNDVDIDGGALTVTSATVNPLQGVVSVNPDGTLRFTPAADFNGVAIITYQVRSAEGDVATQVATVTVNPVGDAPRPANDAVTAAEDQPATFDLLANDGDPEGDALSITGVSVDPSQGTAVINPDGTVTFVPTQDFAGIAVLTYQVTDATGLSATATVVITVTPVNDAPIATDDAAVAAPGKPLVIDPLANDRDIDGDALTITAIDGQPVGPGIAVPVTGGSIAMAADGTLQFVPAAGFSGRTEITYTVADGRGGVATATIAINVEVEVQTTAAPVSEAVPPVRETEPPAATVPYPRIAVEGIILETVAAFGGLDSSIGDLAVKHPLLTAVNGLSRLGNDLLLALEGRTIGPDRIGPFEPPGRGYAGSLMLDNSPNDRFQQMQGLPGGILLGLDASSGNRIVLGAELNGPILILHVRELGVGVTAPGPQLRQFSATLVNGDPLPPWLRWRGDFTLAGNPPPDAEPFDVRITVRLGDGKEVIWIVTVDPHDGHLKAANNERTDVPENRVLFSEQLRAAADPHQMGEPQSLADLIRSASPESRRAS